jgi:prepilin-type N-terminal cleavage/methylation domain-containing protein
MVWQKQRRKGFTIVELLIVIVIIAILAAITVVAYNGVLGRARDSQRLQDMSTIIKGLEIYKTQNGSYPAATFIAGASGWEVSTNGTTATNFLSALTTGSPSISKVPVDPTNKGDASTGTSLTPSRGSNNFEYFYYKYAAGANGCDAARGEYYVLGISRMDTVPVNQSSSASPGFACSGGHDWLYEGAWVTGKFTK